MATVPNRIAGTVDPEVTGDDRRVRTEPSPRPRQPRPPRPADGDADAVEPRPTGARRQGRRQRRVRETDDGQLVFYL